MSTIMAGVIFIASLVIALALVYRPVGDYLYRVYTSQHHLRVERVVYRLIGVDPGREQRWGQYARSLLALSAVSAVLLYAFLRLQDKLWLSLGFPPLKPDLAWNTALSFVTNTNWQAYSGESTMGHLVQMAGLVVQHFISTAVALAVAIAVIRGFTRNRTNALGNFWVDLVRGIVRVLVPVAFVGALIMVAGGVVQNFAEPHTITTLTGGQQVITGGPVASMESIKEFGSNGGGFFNVNSAHPFENPTTWTNWFQIFLFMMIPLALPRVFGRMAGDNRQGYAIVAVMATLALVSVGLVNAAELTAHGTVPQAIGAAMEGKDLRFGVSDSATYGALTTITSTGSVIGFHDSFTALGGGLLIYNIVTGEVAPGGVGSGMYGMLILAVITVFVAGLMVGRTPEYLGKRIGATQIKLASLSFLVTPLLALIGTAVAMSLPDQRAGMANDGAHGFSEVLYAFTSAANNNGSAFAGITVNTTWYNTALGLTLTLGRFLPMLLALALAGSLAVQRRTPVSSGTLPTHGPQFVTLLVGVTIVLVGLTFLPAFALGPLAEGIR
ncbi:potassium-transporting ATPase subunit KdpA [Planotetraspora phitsanulokensis]|uniref:Potassium-transporting ATPase potassium-binding subunit n=1 Tax=Planotetraspora phitsanulokensis TaxID=575192 RepID=A0A8J3U916_9ACTN|nr:potassium-transporting ATPase subunit KdpA [Planotetraspora phitsanulokensis]GII40974.1 potassium-transporting ATPase potassium-binding subunit [Planotetraspora phitsanulokensis]